MKKLISVLLMVLLVCSMAVPAYAEVNQSRAVIGADLTDEQIESVYNMFERKAWGPNRADDDQRRGAGLSGGLCG